MALLNIPALGALAYTSTPSFLAHGLSSLLRPVIMQYDKKQDTERFSKRIKDVLVKELKD